MIELLFTRHALNVCGEGATLYAPSTREEFENGYDASFIGEDCWEIYLQFKTPRVLQPRNGKRRFSISLNQTQHKRLREKYPPFAAFYVFHAFASREEIQEKQMKVTNTKDFLNFYLAVNVRSMPIETTLVHYSCGNELRPSNPLFQRKSDGVNFPTHQVCYDDCFDGASLIELFKGRRIGWLALSDEVKYVGAQATDGEKALEVKEKDEWGHGFALKLFDVAKVR